MYKYIPSFLESLKFFQSQPPSLFSMTLAYQKICLILKIALGKNLSDTKLFFQVYNRTIFLHILFYKSLRTFTGALGYKNVAPGGFPGGAVVESLPANAGDTGSSPGLGRSHMPRSGRAREPRLLSMRVWSLCSATREAATVRGPPTAMKSGPRSPQLEKALAQKRRPNTTKN